MKHILLLTDFSDASQHAIEYALDFFNKTECTFYVMHVYKMSSYSTDNLMQSSATESIFSSIIKEHKMAINQLIKGFKTRNNEKHTFEAVIDYDDFIDAVNQVIKLKKIDLVVIGSNGKTGAQEVIFGSNTLNVIRRVNCTTFVIPKDYTFNANANVVLPIDSTDVLHGTAMLELHKFIAEYNYNLNVLRIVSNRDHEDYEFYDSSNLATIPHQYFVIRNVPTHFASNSFIQIKEVGLCAIVAHKEKFFHRFIKGSSTTKLSNTISIPLLVIHNN